MTIINDKIITCELKDYLASVEKRESNYELKGVLYTETRQFMSVHYPSIAKLEAEVLRRFTENLPEGTEKVFKVTKEIIDRPATLFKDGYQRVSFMGTALIPKITNG